MQHNPHDIVINLPLLVLGTSLLLSIGFALGAAWKALTRRLDERGILEAAYRRAEEHYRDRDERFASKPPAHIQAIIDRCLADDPDTKIVYFEHGTAAIKSDRPGA